LGKTESFLKKKLREENDFIVKPYSHCDTAVLLDVVD